MWTVHTILMFLFPITFLSNTAFIVYYSPWSHFEHSEFIFYSFHFPYLLGLFIFSPYNLNMYGILDVNAQLGAYLSGVPGSPSAPAPPLFTTTPPPPTTPPPTCAPSYVVGYLDNGVRFGLAQESYMMYDLQAAPLLGMFSSRFVKYLEYRLFNGSASFKFCWQIILFDNVLFVLKLQQLFCAF